jgi:guanyl-specific ribonuclease Sa
MSNRWKSLTLALACAGLCGSMAAIAQTTTPTTPPATTSTQDSRLATQYQGLAGSEQNAQSLVTGLRTGTPVTLNSTGTTGTPTTFTPATGKMGYGNINIALSLAKTSLAQQGITNPTPAQLSAALNGGTLTTPKGTVTMAGVLSQRQTGMGWGQIAKSMGVKLGSVVSASKTDKAGTKSEQTAKAKSAQVASNHSKSTAISDHAGGNHGGSGGKGGGGGNGGGGGGGKK